MKLKFTKQNIRDLKIALSIPFGSFLFVGASKGVGAMFGSDIVMGASIIVVSSCVAIMAMVAIDQINPKESDE